MENGEAFLLLIDALGLAFLAFYGWHVLIKKNDPGIVGLSISAIISVQLIGTFVDYVAG